MGLRLKKAAALLALAAVCLAATGCAFRFSVTPDELYSLPQLPEEYEELEGRISAILEDGAEYAAPTAGTNIQPVQLYDLDGDGREEALAFFRKSSDEKPLKVYIFSARGKTYQETAVIEGSGSSIYSVEYADLDSDGRMELVIGWQDAKLQALSVYALHTGAPEELLRTAYVRYEITNFDQDDRREIVLLRADGEGSSVADFYTWQGRDTLTLTSTARISMTMAELGLGAVRSGTLTDGAPALFVSGVEDSTVMINDILTLRDGELVNLTLSGVTGVSSEIFRYLALFPMDVNGDGVTEIPAPVRLPSADGVEAEGLEAYYRIDWRSYGPDGEGETVQSTYHATEDGWYLTLPDEWSGRIAAVRRQSASEEFSVTFSYLTGGDALPQEFLSIYTITGNSRDIKAARDGRFVLSRQPETIYAAKLLDGGESWPYALTADQLADRFSLITNEWIDN